MITRTNCNEYWVARVLVLRLVHVRVHHPVRPVSQRTCALSFARKRFKEGLLLRSLSSLSYKGTRKHQSSPSPLTPTHSLSIPSSPSTQAAPTTLLTKPLLLKQNPASVSIFFPCPLVMVPLFRSPPPSPAGSGMGERASALKKDEH